MTVPIVWEHGRMVGAARRGVRLDFEAMPEEGVEALRVLRNREYVGVIWFLPFNVNAEVCVRGHRHVLTDFDDVEDLLDEVLGLVEGY